MKYIVYLTTNNKSKINGQCRVYVGVHQVVNPNIFDGYLGNGVYINQASSFKYPKTPFQWAVKKYGVDAFKRQTLYVCDTKKEAYKIVSELVNEDFIKQEHVYNACTGKEQYSDKTVYQFNLEGKFIKKWQYAVDAQKFYNFTKEKLGYAIIDKHPLVNSLWAETPRIDIKEYTTKPWGASRVTHLYSKNGKWIREFMTRKDCADYLGLPEKIVVDAVKQQRFLLNKYYVSDKLTDVFIPKARRQYKYTKFYVYKDYKYIGEYVGKKLMPVIKLHSWAKIRNIMTLRNGWYEDFYISETRINESEIPEKQTGIQVDVYTNYGDFIETLKSLSELKEKYNVPKSKIKNIQLGDKYFGDYVFKYHSRKQ